MDDIVTVEEAAIFLHKHPSTIRRWIDMKKLKAKHIAAGGHGIYAILRADLLEIVIVETMQLKEKAKEEMLPAPVSRGQTHLPI